MNNKKFCENCEKELTAQEIIWGEGWCFNCALPEKEFTANNTQQERVCQKCFKSFPESGLDLSHDIPKYIGGADKDGRHYLCKRCHDIYEKTCFKVMTGWLTNETKEIMKRKVKEFSKHYFKEEEVKDGCFRTA